MAKSSEKYIVDYIERRKQLLMNRVTNKFNERRSKMSRIIQPITDYNYEIVQIRPKINQTASSVKRNKGTPKEKLLLKSMDYQ